MQTFTRAFAMLSVLAGCSAPPPSNPSPCEVSHASQACQIEMYNRAGA